MGNLDKRSILYVSENPLSGLELRDCLNRARCRLLDVVRPNSDILAWVLREQPDLLLIDVDSPSFALLESLEVVVSVSALPVVMLSRNRDGHLIQRAINAGVTCYEVGTIGHLELGAIVDAAIAGFERLRNLSQAMESARVKLAESYRIDRARSHLMMKLGIAEEEARVKLLSLARERQRRLVDVADSVLTVPLAMV
ncbi:MAG: ANTAR domain-containing protein [gamma proteobacterium endosymbiont of Lamellibrachia anaximandri]|nr:ANTAR domain-containing protein [gamma proteobacterium endosymbiont of Lamellibrachia anaximandri]